MLGAADFDAEVGAVVLRVVRLVVDAAFASSLAASSAGALSSPVGMPSFCLMRFSISSAMSGLARRKFRAFSLPWPSWVPS